VRRKLTVATEHQDQCCGLVHDREWIALAVIDCDNPAREFNHCVGYLLAFRKLVDGRRLWCGGILGAVCAIVKTLYSPAGFTVGLKKARRVENG
jgi:hypothetical protein